MSDTAISGADAGAPPGSGKASHDNSPDDVGKTITSPWVPDHPVDITQQYGATDYTGEPSGHGQPHWHAGVDLGYPSNTIVQFPTIAGNDAQSILSSLIGIPIAEIKQLMGQNPGAVWVGTMHHGSWNGDKYAPDPSGYGSHVATITMNAFGKDLLDVVLGHGSGYLVGDGAAVRPGDSLIKVDSEGNSTGPHLHFEVRPPKGRYGTDVDPWQVVSTGIGAAISAVGQNVGADVQAAANSISGAITGAVRDAENIALGLALSGAGVLALGAATWLAFRRGAASPVPGPPRPQRAPQRPTQPVQHPAARVARATRAAPAAPRIPTAPSQAVPSGGR